MAMDEVTHIGFTAASLTDKINNDVTSLRIAQDNIFTTDINTNLISLDAEQKDNADRVRANVAIVMTDVDLAKNARYLTVGPVEVEPTPLGQSLTAKLNSVGSYYTSIKTDLDKIKPTATLITEHDDILETSNENKTIINTNLAASGTIDTLKELSDMLAVVDINDVETPLGFENSITKAINKKATNAPQQEGNCLIYKDEVTKNFYELYIRNGLIELKTVHNPDKDIITTYLNQDIVTNNMVIDSSGPRAVVSKINSIVLGDYEYYVATTAHFYSSASKTIASTHSTNLLKRNITTGVIQLISNTVFTAAYNVNYVISSINADVKIMIINNEVCLLTNLSYTSNDTAGVILTSSSPIFKYLKINQENDTIIQSSSSTSFNFETQVSDKPTLGIYGVTQNTNYYFITESNNNVKVFSKANGSLFSTITLPTSFKFHSNGSNDIVADDVYLYIASSDGDISTIIKILINDGSVQTNKTIVDFQDKLFIVGQNIVTTRGYTTQTNIDYYDKSTLELAVDPMYINSYISNPYSTIEMVFANGDILLKTSSGFAMCSPEGYELFSNNDSGATYYGTSDKAIVSVQSVLNQIKLYVNPIYKYK